MSLWLSWWYLSNSVSWCPQRNLMVDESLGRSRNNCAGDSGFGSCGFDTRRSAIAVFLLKRSKGSLIPFDLRAGQAVRRTARGATTERRCDWIFGSARRFASESLLAQAAV